MGVEMNDTSRLLDAAMFAAERHRDQRRKGADASPYINHPLGVAKLLSVEGGIADVEVLMAALLHDTIEDTDTTEQELLDLFGERVTAIVLEVTDDKSLPKAERKKLQISHAGLKSPEAAMVKIADKICNLRDIAESPPADWSAERRREYFEWAAKVVDRLPPVNTTLRELFTSAYALMPIAQVGAPNCTRVTARHGGLNESVTFRDHESEKMKAFIEHERAGGATITTERGVWID
jgi:guanosine-3',5'-bis(diphosphate) 3'-pyrophosphohydrolase